MKFWIAIGYLPRVFFCSFDFNQMAYFFQFKKRMFELSQLKAQIKKLILDNQFSMKIT